MRHGTWVLLLVAAGASACSTIFGDFTFQGTSTGTITTSTTGTTGTGMTNVCDAGEPCCDAGVACGGVCVDTTSDKHNCGRCGHDCLNGLCSESMCQAWPVATNVTVTAMAADEHFVAWVDASDAVHQVPVDGGMVLTVAQSAGSVQDGGPVLNGGTVAFCGSDRIYGVPEGQTSTTTESFFTNVYTAGPLALASNGVTAYMLGTTASSPYSYYLLACPLLDTGNNFCMPAGLDAPVDAAVQGMELASNLLVNATYAFWIYDGSSPSVTRYGFGSNVVDAYDFTAAGAFALAIDTSNVYWVGAPNSSIYSLPQAFASATTPMKLAVTMEMISGLASDGTGVYFGMGNAGLGNAALAYVPVGGGDATTIYTSPNATGLGAESFVVAAGGAVYWADVNLDMFPPAADIMGIAAP